MSPLQTIRPQRRPPMSPRTALRAKAAVVVVVLVLAACGSGDSESGASDPARDTTVPATDAVENPESDVTTGDQAPPGTQSPTTTVDPQVDIEQLTLPDEAVAAPEPAELSPLDFPRTVTHDFGAAEIAELPQRIVATAGVADLDALLSLGIVPYATALYYPVNFAGDLGLASWNTDYADELITLPRDPSIEEVARLDPDLIVGQPGPLTENLALYSEIAPTVVHNSPSDWREPIVLFGEALGLEDEANAAIERIETEIDVIAERVPADAPSVALVSPLPGGQVVIYNENLGAGPARALSDIGLEIVGPDGPISYERLEDLADADWIIVFDFTLGPVDEFLAEPLFQQLPAAQAGNVARLSPEQSFSWILETSRSLPATLDGILSQIGL